MPGFTSTVARAPLILFQATAAERDAWINVPYGALFHNITNDRVEYFDGEQWLGVPLLSGLPANGAGLVWDTSKGLWLPTAQGTPTFAAVRVHGDGTAVLEVKRFYKNLAKTGTGTGTMAVTGEHTCGAADTDFKVEIDSAGSMPWAGATFKWSNDGGATWEATNVPIASGAESPEQTLTILLENGVYVVFSGGGSTFDSGDYWTFTAIGTANQLYDLKVDTAGSEVWIGNKLLVGNDPNFGLWLYGDDKALFLGGKVAILADAIGAALNFVVDQLTPITLVGEKLYVNRWMEMASTTPPTGADLPDSTCGILYAGLVDPVGRPFWVDHTGAYSQIALASEIWTVIDALGDLLYGSANDTIAKLAGNTTTTKKFLRQVGTGSASEAPAWDTIADTDVPTTHSGSPHETPVSRVHLWDDFLMGGVVSGQIGALGWQVVNGGVTGVAGVANHPGILARTTGTTIDTQCSLVLATAATSGPVIGTELFDATFIFKTGPSIADIRYYVGMVGTYGAYPPGGGAYFRFDTASGDTKWQAITRLGASQTVTDTGITVVADTWYKMRIVRGSSDVTFYIDAVLVATNTATLPTAALAPDVDMINLAASSKSYNLDFFELVITGVTR